LWWLARVLLGLSVLSGHRSNGQVDAMFQMGVEARFKVVALGDESMEALNG